MNSYGRNAGIGEAARRSDGLWSAAVPVGRATDLVAALDPDLAYVVIQTWDGISGWHESPVTIDADERPRAMLVRHHCFEVLVTPSEAAEIGRVLSARRVGSGLKCWQLRELPRADFELPQRARDLGDAMRGLGVELAIDLPHELEVAVVASPDRDVLDDYRVRFASR